MRAGEPSRSTMRGAPGRDPSIGSVPGDRASSCASALTRVAPPERKKPAVSTAAPVNAALAARTIRPMSAAPPPRGGKSVAHELVAAPVLAPERVVAVGGDPVRGNARARRSCGVHAILHAVLDRMAAALDGLVELPFELADGAHEEDRDEGDDHQVLDEARATSARRVAESHGRSSLRDGGRARGAPVLSRGANEQSFHGSFRETRCVSVAFHGGTETYDRGLLETVNSVASHAGTGACSRGSEGGDKPRPYVPGGPLRRWR